MIEHRVKLKYALENLGSRTMVYEDIHIFVVHIARQLS